MSNSNSSERPHRTAPVKTLVKKSDWLIGFDCQSTKLIDLDYFPLNQSQLRQTINCEHTRSISDSTHRRSSTVIFDLYDETSKKRQLRAQKLCTLWNFETLISKVRSSGAEQLFDVFQWIELWRYSKTKVQTTKSDAILYERAQI